MDDHEASELETCAVCERTILKGETLFDYVTPAGESKRVCALCRRRAEAAGWMPAHLAEEIVRAAPAIAARPSARLAGPRSSPPEPAPREPEPEAPPVRDERPLQVRALEAFNAGPEPHKIAGLRRSLGEPTAAVEEGEDTVVVTVAWELSWYRWEVSPWPDGAEIAEVAKGSEIEEIDPPPREWNARVADDGSVHLEHE